MHTNHTRRVRFPIHNSASLGGRTLLVAAAAIALGSCSLLGWSLGAPPLEYRSVAIVIGDHGVLHRDAGVHYELVSVASRRIVAFEVAFDLYDDSSRPVPGVGRNSFRSPVADRIDPGESCRYSISLDPIPGGPHEGLLLSRFRVTRVEFDDGSLWHNSGAHLYEEGDS